MKVVIMQDLFKVSGGYSGEFAEIFSGYTAHQANDAQSQHTDNSSFLADNMQKIKISVPVSLLATAVSTYLFFKRDSDSYGMLLNALCIPISFGYAMSASSYIAWKD